MLFPPAPPRLVQHQHFHQECEDKSHISRPQLLLGAFFHGIEARCPFPQEWFVPGILGMSQGSFPGTTRQL